MKKIFIIVSVLASAYLAMQTNTFQLGLNHVSAVLFSGKAHQVQQAIYSATNAETKMGKDSESEASRVKLGLSEAQHNELLKRITELESSLSDLEEKLSPNIDENTDVETDTPPVAVIRNIDNANRASALLVSNENVETKQVIVGRVSPHAEAQKRIQQQAILRALSQKMELAALSGL